MQSQRYKPKNTINQGLFLLAFIMLGMVNISSLIFFDGKGIGYQVSKSLLMPTLFMYYWMFKASSARFEHFLVMGALFFSWAGDVLLMYESSLFFLLGLGSFLLAHICYILCFSLTLPPYKGKSYLGKHPWAYLPFLLYAALLFWLIYGGLGNMTVPVLVYATVICVMSLTALNRWNRVSEISFGYVFLGALLFMLSDSLIAVGKFASDVVLIPFRQIWVMLTYMTAQYLIIHGILLHQTHPKPQQADMN
ncbi:MAG: lysoplasmalogenase [Bacteroidota bacterium]